MSRIAKKGPQCGAKARSNGGQPCRKHVKKAGQRCRNHGGKSTGPKDFRKNTNAVTHGFYSDALLPDERKLYERAHVGNVDDELRLARVKLHRYARLSGSVELQEMVDGALDVISKVGTAFDAVVREIVPFDKREIKAAAPDYADLIIRQIDLIRKLELARKELELNGQPPALPPVGRIEVEIVGAKHKDDDD